jgi:MFS family permease
MVSRLRTCYSVVLGALAVSGLSFAFSQTMLVPSLPDIEAAFHAMPSEATTLITAFLVSGAATAGLFGRLGEHVPQAADDCPYSFRCSASVRSSARLPPDSA